MTSFKAAPLNYIQQPYILLCGILIKVLSFLCFVTSFSFLDELGRELVCESAQKRHLETEELSLYLARKLRSLLCSCYFICYIPRQGVLALYMFYQIPIPALSLVRSISNSYKYLILSTNKQAGACSTPARLELELVSGQVIFIFQVPSSSFLALVIYLQAKSVHGQWRYFLHTHYLQLCTCMHVHCTF